MGRGHSWLHRQRSSELAERVEQVKRFITPLRLRSLGADSGRKVTWLELFFDLIFVVVMLAMTAIRATSTGRQRSGSSSVTRSLVLAAATLTIGIVGQLESPVILIITIAGLCIAQLAVSLAHAPQPAPLAHAVVHLN